ISRSSGGAPWHQSYLLPWTRPLETPVSSPWQPTLPPTKDENGRVRMYPPMPPEFRGRTPMAPASPSVSLIPAIRGATKCCPVVGSTRGRVFIRWIASPVLNRRSTMEVLFPRCAGLDVHKKSVTACLITPDGKEIRTFGTMTPDLLEMGDWLQSHGRSEEHTSELQSRENFVCRILLEKKKIAST